MKRSVKTAALIIAALLLFCACGGGKSSQADREYTEPGYARPSAEDASSAYTKYYTISKYNNAADTEYKTDPGESSVLDRDNTKIIRRASMALQTKEFDETVKTIEAYVLEKGGYMESESVNNGAMRSGAYRYRTASFTARIPAENYTGFLSGMNDKCHVVSLTQNVQDVGEQYFNTEQRLETLKNKHDRLEALLKEAKEMKDIISLEEALSETEYEINSYTAALNKYDSLIGFSTITITLEEVIDPDSSVTEDPGFFQRLGKSFKRGLDNFGDTLEDLIMWVSYNVFAIIVFVIIVIVLVKKKPFAKLRKRLAGGKNEITEDTSDSGKN